LGRQVDEARRRGNVERYEKLKAEQQAMTKYQPEMLHSPADNTKRIVFHPQLLSDFDTICDLAKRMNETLDIAPRQTIKRILWRTVFGLEELLGRARSLLAAT
jgi:hypothetical protein